MIDGVLLVDKPAGMTSHDVVARVRKALSQRNVGHAGTLDPDATGLLVMLLGRGTKLAPYVSQGDKRYSGTIVLGVATDSMDASGDVTGETDVPDISADRVEHVFRRFTGTITQTVPVVSAVKVDGRRLYNYARSGDEVELPEREVTIKRLILTSIVLGEHPELRFDVTCSKGTYVRALAADIGQEMGYGGHLKDLRRLESAPFSVDAANPLEDIEQMAADGSLEDEVLPLQAALGDAPLLEVDAEEVRQIRNGAPIDAREWDGFPEQGTILGIVGHDRTLLAVHRSNGPDSPTSVERVIDIGSS